MAKLEFEEALDYTMRQADEKFDDVVLEAERTQARQLKFTNNEITTGKIWMEQSISVFAALDKRTAMTDILELDKRTIDATLQKLLKFVKKSEPSSEYLGIADNEDFRYNAIENTNDTRISRMEDDWVDYVDKGINAALAHGALRASGNLQVATTKEVLKTNHEVHAHQTGTSATFSIRAFVDKESSAHKLSCARVLAHFKPEEAGAKAGEMAKQAYRPVAGKAGKYDVIFEPLAAANLLEHVADATSIFSVEAGFSFLENRMNRRVASDIVSLYDDARMPGGMNSTMYDSEGVPAKKNILIRFGVLRTWLHNTSTARRYDTQTTANAGLIAPHPWNVVLEKGNHSLRELIGEVKNGLWVTNLWYARFQNYKTGEFSTLPRDAIFVIENGKIAGSWKGLRLSDNLAKMLMNVAAIGEKREQILGWEVETPVKTGHLLIRNVHFTKAQEKFGEAHTGVV